MEVKKHFNMRSLSPNIFVHNIPETIAFYGKLGFTVSMSVPETGEAVWVMMTCAEVTFMFQSFESLGADLPDIKRTNGGSLLLYMQVDNIREFFSKIKDSCTVVVELHKTFYGATEFSILDCNGYVLTFAEDEK
jgi:uncharacterized glyoxalase superfamily protein PhnB